MLPTGELSRFPRFMACLLRLMAHTPCTLAWNVGLDIAFNCNDALRRRDPWGEWVWVIGDDHTFEPDIIDRLWAHGVDVVVPLVLQRNHPHRTVLYQADGSPIQLEPGQRGLVPVGMAGSAGMLIRESTLIAVGDPWFRIMGSERQGEDLGFCRAVTAAGHRIYCDLDTTIGHIATVEVWPVRRDDGQLTVAYKQPNIARLL